MRRTALLVGVENYRDKLTSSFEFARADAIDLAMCLQGQCGFDDVRLFADLEGPRAPERENVLGALEEMARECRPEDLFLFGYFGHGVEKDGRGYLMTSDGRQAVPDQGCLSFATLKRVLDDMQARWRVIILDAFRHSPKCWKASADHRMNRTIAQELTALAQPKAEDRVTTVLLSGCRAGQRTHGWPEKGHGVFASCLLESVGGDAWLDGQLHLENLAGAVSKKVREWSRRNLEGDIPQAVWYERFGRPQPIVIAGNSRSARLPVETEKEERPVSTEESVPQAAATVEAPAEPEAAEFRLPPVPDEIRALQGNLEKLKLARLALQEDHHLTIDTAHRALRAAEEEFSRLKGDLKRHSIGLDSETEERLVAEVAKDLDMTPEEICDSIGETPTDALLNYIQRVREVEQARRFVKKAREDYEGAKRREIAPIEKQIAEIEGRIKSWQEKDLGSVLDAIFEFAKSMGDLPLEAWEHFEPLLTERYLLWDAETIRAKAGTHYSKQLHEQAARRDGEGVSANGAKAVEPVGRAAESESAQAQFERAQRFHLGQGVEQNDEEAVSLLRKAAKRGHAGAQFNLGTCYYAGRGVDRDLAEAVKWYRRAALQGHTKAQYNLAACYSTGRGVPQDHAEAVKWYLRAAENGHPRAQYRLGRCYAAGEGVPSDPAEAFRWYRKAAEQGDAGAQFNLGSCYYYGVGGEQDPIEAFRWLQQAASQGHEAAKKLLEKIGPATSRRRSNNPESIPAVDNPKL